MNLKHFIILSLIFCFKTHAQNDDNEKLIKNIKKEVTQFFIDKTFLKEKSLEKLNDIFIIEIYNEKPIEFLESGIYCIGVYQSHSEKHILVKDNSVYRIYDLKKIDIALQEIINFCKRNNIDNDRMMFYIKNVIQKYDDNYSYKYISFEKKE
jgi:hypothetical protein